MYPAYAKEATLVIPNEMPYIVALNVPVIHIEQAVPQWTYCSCVEFAKWKLGKQGEVWGHAGNMIPTSKVPYVGGLVLTSEGKGHVAVITAVNDHEINIIEGNYKSCQKTKRILSRDDPKIKGYK